MTDDILPRWRWVCREGWLPALSDGQLEGLRAALAGDDARLCQNQTTEPVTALAPDWPCQQACPVAFSDWQGRADTVTEVEEVFARRCKAIDDRLDEIAGVRHLLHFIDETPRAEVVAGLLEEVRREQQRRAGA